MVVQEVLAGMGLAEDAARWARCLNAIMREAGLLAPATSHAAYGHICGRLQVSTLEL